MNRPPGIFIHCRNLSCRQRFQITTTNGQIITFRNQPQYSYLEVRCPRCRLSNKVFNPRLLFLALNLEVPIQIAGKNAPKAVRQTIHDFYNGTPSLTQTHLEIHRRARGIPPNRHN